MSDDLTFGDVKETAPVVAPRPESIPRWAVERLPPPRDVQSATDLSVYVDLDVMRELISHAKEDTDVELGGVLMGTQATDEDGVPFVMVTDSIRAQHYQATRGSFKFTHDTWQQITRDREPLDRELQMVGWYHTHPGWGVFLSGMDDFICENFFARPLDVALVIDPCRDEHGWFQWEQGQTRLTGDVAWFTKKNRVKELKAFVETFTQEPEMTTRLPIRTQTTANGTTVQVIESRQPEWFMIGSLALQATTLLLFAWMLLRSTTSTIDTQNSANKTTHGTTLESQDARQLALLEIKNELLLAQLTSQGGNGGDTPALIDSLAKVQLENAKLSESVESHAMRLIELEESNRELVAREKQLSQTNERLSAELQEADSLIKQSALNKTDPSERLGDATDATVTSWWWWTGTVISALGLLAAALWWWSKRDVSLQLSDES